MHSITETFVSLIVSNSSTVGDVMFTFISMQSSVMCEWAVGFKVGDTVGDEVGIKVGDKVGEKVALVGEKVGLSLGIEVGAFVGGSRPEQIRMNMLY
jgi:hypothetical protein